MDRDLLCDSLINWLKSLNLLQKDVIIDFHDGIFISKCLNHIDPQYFNEEWLNKLKYDVNDNWRLKLLNLKKIFDALTDYYSEILNHPLNGFEIPNLNLLFESTSSSPPSSVDSGVNGQSQNKAELSKLLQLVLGVAVNCERKSEYIEMIMEMNVDEQHMIMTAIQDLMSKERTKSANNDDDLNYQLKKALLELNRVNEQKEEIEQKCRSLDSQLAMLHDEKTTFLNEIEMLKDKLQQEDNVREELGRQKKLQQRIDLMQEELYKLDTLKEEYRIKYEAVKQENESLMEKNTEFKKISKQTQLLKDELDILKHNTDKVNKLEATIETYKIKLEEMSDLRAQIKLLEESNTKYMETIIQMEDDAKKITSLKSQIDLYKKQMQELHESILTNEMKVKKYEYENKRYEEKLNGLQHDKERLLNELESLKLNHVCDNNNRLESDDDPEHSGLQVCSSQNNHFVNDDLSSICQISELELLSLPPEVKEKIIRLYHENRILKTKQNEMNDEKLILLQNQYDDEKQRNNELQSKLNSIQSKNIELESALSDAEQAKKDDHHRDQLNTKFNDLLEVKQKLSAKNLQLEDECKKMSLNIQKLETNNELIVKEKAELKDALGLKDKEIADTKEKYEVYLEKAKFIIKTLDPNNNQVANSEVNTLKNELTDRDKKINELTNEIEKMKQSFEKEEQLMMSAWNKLVTNLNRNTTDERLDAMSGNSFLSQQRSLFIRQSSATPSPATIKK